MLATSLDQALPLLQPFKCELLQPSLDAALSVPPAIGFGSTLHRQRRLLQDVSVLASCLPPSMLAKVDIKRMERAMAVNWTAQLLTSVKQEKLSHVVTLIPYASCLFMRCDTEGPPERWCLVCPPTLAPLRVALCWV